jgi:glucose-6-phosphate dehydrogenase assembly protein OpcA
VEATLTTAAELTSIREIEREIVRLREESSGPDKPALRTSSMTHLAWVPARWVEVARGTLEGLAERHPSRTILLFPEPDADRDALTAELDLRCFAGGDVAGPVCWEVVAIRLLGERAGSPASVVQPLLLPDLPAFLRWRGPLGTSQGDRELISVVDRLVIDSSECPDLESELSTVADLFDEVTVSDIAWSRARSWREAIAGLWPEVANASLLRVAGPEADALLLAGWLRSRLDRPVELKHEPAGEIELVEVDEKPVAPDRVDRRTASDLLSDELDVFWRDRIYEEAVKAATVAA